MDLKLRTFKLVRNEDESGVSGTGEVAEGVEFKNGKCVMCWDTDTSSIAVYENVTDLVNIHGHQGKTVVKFSDGQIVSDVKDYSVGTLVEITKSSNNQGYVGVWAVVTGIKDKCHYRIYLIGNLPLDDMLTSRDTWWYKDWVKAV